MFYRDKRVLVTGGTGFIGTHIVRALLKAGARVHISVHKRPADPEARAVEAFPADLAKLDECRAAVRGVEYVIHAAGSVGAAGVKGYNMMESITKNLILTANVLQASWAEGVRKILIFGSSTGYPPCAHPVREEEMWRDEPYPAYTGYGWMRRYLEKLGEYVSGQSECKAVVIRPSAVYGPGDNFSEQTGHVIPALIRRAVSGENPFVVWGTGDEIRDFIHVRDFARACLLALAKCGDFDQINIGAGRGSTVREVVGLILKHAGRQDVQVVYDSSKPTTIPFRMVSIEKARRILDFEPQISLEEGIGETVRWYMSALARPGR
jgi:GDP-L-fucose synthase